MKRTYEAWRDPQDDSIDFAPSDAISEARRQGHLGPHATRLFTVEAHTHEEALAIYHLPMGWEPYRPVGEPSPCRTCGALVYTEGSGECWSCGETA